MEKRNSVLTKRKKESISLKEDQMMATNKQLRLIKQKVNLLLNN
jgi:hypothetical protein